MRGGGEPSLGYWLYAAARPPARGGAGMFVRIVALARKLRRSREGAVAIMMGFILVGMIGMSALGVEMGFAYYKQRQMQSAADAAALGAAIAKSKSADITAQARALTAAVGFVDGADGVTVTVANPPTSGPNVANALAVEVRISQPQTLHLVTLFRSGLFNIGVRAVALVDDLGKYCVLGLDKTAANAVFLDNNATINVPNCGVGSNSSSNSALRLDNNASITGGVSVVGNWSLGNNAQLPTDPAPKNHADAVDDPYFDRDLNPPTANCVNAPASCKNCTITFTQGGHYCGFNYTQGNVTLNLAQGTYYIKTRLNLSNNVTVNATGGVTIVINGNYAMNINNNAIINITAPTGGPTAGLAFASIRTATATKTQIFDNNTTLNLNGAIYFPKQIVKFENNATINAPVCGQVIARIVQIANNGALNSNCARQITSGGATRLVE
jgi:hypothetical protein